MLKLTGINKSYFDKTVFDNFSAEFKLGEITAVLGASGSGKTTLLNIISSLTQYEGAVDNLPNKISYIFQEDRLISNLTVAENITLTGGGGLPLEEVLTSVELCERSGSYINSLSGGMKRRVALARAFYYGGELLLMDEPFSGLDLGLKMRLIEMFKKLREQTKVTTIFVTHSIDEALLTADRIVVLNQSKIIFDAPNTSINKQSLRESLISLMLSL